MYYFFVYVMVLICFGIIYFVVHPFMIAVYKWTFTTHTQLHWKESFKVMALRHANGQKLVENHIDGNLADMVEPRL